MRESKSFSLVTQLPSKDFSFSILLCLLLALTELWKYLELVLLPWSKNCFARCFEKNHFSVLGCVDNTFEFPWKLVTHDNPFGC